MTHQLEGGQALTVKVKLLGIQVQTCSQAVQADRLTDWNASQSSLWCNLQHYTIK